MKPARRGRVERRLVAILAADVAGYSRLMGADEEGTLERLKALRRELVDPKITEHHGRIVKTTGDGLLVEFGSVVDAVRCAVAVQQAMPERNTDVTTDNRIELRIGINLGDVIVEGDDLYGDGVNIAARIEALADAGGVFVSNTVHDQVRDRLPFVFEDLGEQQVKNIARPVRVCRVRDAGTGKSSSAPAPPVLTLPDKPSIAVLPFANMSGDPEQEYFADGMVEEIITALSRIRWLFVIARNSSFTYKGQAVDVKRVGRELGVRYVLEGSVRKGGNRVRITAQLIDAASGAHLWADRFDGALEDIFDLQEKVATSVAGVIEPELAKAEQQRVLRSPLENLDAWEAYQRGLWHLYKYQREENQIAQTFFHRAIALDPNFAPGHYGYALALWLDLRLYWVRSFTEVQETILKEVRIAVVLDAKDAMAHAVLAMSMAGEWEAAIVEARTALALNPNSAFVQGVLGQALWFGGYHHEANDQLRRAMRASPHDPLTWAWTLWLGLSQFFSRDFAAALETFGWVVRHRPETPHVHEYIAASLAYLGRLDKAREALNLARPHFSEQPWPRQQRPPWARPEDWALRTEGLRLAASEAG